MRSGAVLLEYAILTCVVAATVLIATGQTFIWFDGELGMLGISAQYFIHRINSVLVVPYP